MTEDEAKAKVCAFTRERRQSGAADMCLGSACMAWRNRFRIEAYYNTGSGATDIRAVPVGGYCVRLGDAGL